MARSYLNQMSMHIFLRSNTQCGNPLRRVSPKNDWYFQLFKKLTLTKTNQKLTAAGSWQVSTATCIIDRPHLISTIHCLILYLQNTYSSAAKLHNQCNHIKVLT